MAMDDASLRKELTRFGVDVGPITDTTRPLYANKLKRLSLEGGPSPPKQGTNGRKGSEDRNTDVSRSCLNLSEHLNDGHHVTSDTVFLFPDGEKLFVCRGILGNLCDSLCPLLYRIDEPFIVNIVMLSGQSYHVFIRPSEVGWDLKEKVTLRYNIDINQIRLVYNSTEIEDTLPVSEQGITSGCHVNLVMKAQPTTSKISYVQISNPTVSISHLNLPFGLDQVIPMSQGPPMGQPTRSVLPPQIQHMVHVYNVPSPILKVFIYYLYNCDVPSTEIVNPSLLWTGVSVLAEHYKCQRLKELCFNALSYTLSQDSTLLPQIQEYGSKIRYEELKNFTIE